MNFNALFFGIGATLFVIVNIIDLVDSFTGSNIHVANGFVMTVGIMIMAIGFQVFDNMKEKKN